MAQRATERGDYDGIMNNWRSAFEAAVVEVETEHMADKITEAKHIISDRVKELHGSNPDGELQQLNIALDVLGDLSEICLKGSGRAAAHN